MIPSRPMTVGFENNGNHTRTSFPGFRDSMGTIAGGHRVNVGEAADLAAVLMAKGWTFVVEFGQLHYDGPDGPGFDIELALVRSARVEIITAFEDRMIPLFPDPLPTDREGTIPEFPPLADEIARTFARNHSGPDVDRRLARLAERAKRTGGWEHCSAPHDEPRG